MKRLWKYSKACSIKWKILQNNSYPFGISERIFYNAVTKYPFMKFTPTFLKSFTVASFDIPIISEWQCKNLYFQNFFIIFYISSLRYFKIYSHFGIYFRISVLIFPFWNLFQNIVSVANHNTFVYELFTVYEN